jgi:hypothetical protein
MTLHSEQCSCRSGLRQSAARFTDATLAQHLPAGAGPEIVKLFTHWIAKNFHVRIPARFQEAQGP